MDYHGRIRSSDIAAIRDCMRVDDDNPSKLKCLRACNDVWSGVTWLIENVEADDAD